MTQRSGGGTDYRRQEGYKRPVTCSVRSPELTLNEIPAKSGKRTHYPDDKGSKRLPEDSPIGLS